MSTTNRNREQTAHQKLAEGLKKHEQALSLLTIDGTSFKTADVIATVQARVDSAQAVVSSRATWQANILSDKAERTKTKTFLSGLRKALFVAFGNSVDVLADFGLAPHKPRVQRTPEEKTAAAAKAKATRAARHTMGKKQRQAIKGTAPHAAPATAPVATPAPATPANPSPAASAAPPGPAAPHTGS
jgi:hypothetical protein